MHNIPPWIWTLSAASGRPAVQLAALLHSSLMAPVKRVSADNEPVNNNVIQIPQAIRDLMIRPPAIKRVRLIIAWTTFRVVFATEEGTNPESGNCPSASFPATTPSRHHRLGSPR